MGKIVYNIDFFGIKYFFYFKRDIIKYIFKKVWIVLNICKIENYYKNNMGICIDVMNIFYFK